MDNILKLIFGCLGLVGLIVMIVPNSDPLASTKPNAEGATPIASVQGAPPPQPTVAEATTRQDQPNPSEFVVDDYDIGSFGQPMVDPTPPGQRNQNTQEPQAQQQGVGLNNNQFANGQANVAQAQIGGTESLGPAGPPPPLPITGN